jgi:DNA invertase Pin-like site-specific DNA recombinase
MRIALGYVRVSTDEQAERGLGLEAQRQRIRAYCEMKGSRPFSRTPASRGANHSGAGRREAGSWWRRDAPSPLSS